VIYFELHSKIDHPPVSNLSLLHRVYFANATKSLLQYEQQRELSLFVGGDL
jgi:hypothetical protein